VSQVMEIFGKMVTVFSVFFASTVETCLTTVETCHITVVTCRSTVVICDNTVPYLVEVRLTQTWFVLGNLIRIRF
jgi:hypothetical protein